MKLAKAASISSMIALAKLHGSGRLSWSAGLFSLRKLLSRRQTAVYSPWNNREAQPGLPGRADAGWKLLLYAVARLPRTPFRSRRGHTPHIQHKWYETNHACRQDYENPNKIH
jgi:hypothetical protein